MPRTKTTILGTDRLGEERVVKTTEDAEQDGEDEGLSCIDLTRRTAPPMAVEGAKQRAAERAAAGAAARAVARQLGGGEDGRRGAKQPSQEQGSCGAPGCEYADFHLEPCSNLGADNGGERKRRRSSSGKGMAAKAAKAAKVKEVKAAKAATKATAKLLQEQEDAKAAAEKQSGRRATRVSRGGSAAAAGAKEKEKEASDDEEAEQLWAHCDACGKWRRLPESMRDSDELDEAWTCAMHPDPALRGCEVSEEALEEDEVESQMELPEQGSCGTPGCDFADFHLGPCSHLIVSGGRRNRGRR